MANSRLTNVYKMLKDYNFASENAIGSDAICTICNKILINAHNAPCGCRYCLECITAYLDGEDKCCPGNTGDCKIDLLNINNNIHIDQPMNMKISRLMVKCPEGQCDERVELRKLEDHFEICNWRPTDCPFFNVGCSVQMTKDKVEEHILSDNHAHTKLLLDYIVVLREEVTGKQIMIDDFQAIIAQQSREIDRLGEEIVALGNVNRRMQDQINGHDTRMDSYEAVNSEMRNYGEIMTKMNEKLEQMALQGSNVDVKIGGLEGKLMAMAAQQNQLNYGEFVWPIDNFSDKRREAQNDIETRIFSEPFFSHKNGYKMCLSVFPDGCSVGKGTDLSVYLHSMRGPFDDILEWPCKCDVTIAIINQQSRLSHVSTTLKYNDSPFKSNWDKPKQDIIWVDGDDQFIKLVELMSDISLYVNDRIFIKCTVQIS